MLSFGVVIEKKTQAGQEVKQNTNIILFLPFVACKKNEN